MAEAHYFETDEQLTPERLENILRTHGIEISNQRSPFPKEGGVILSPFSIQSFWELSTGQNECTGKCLGSPNEHQGWDDLSETQQHAFNQSVIQTMNGSLIGTTAASFLTEDSRFPGIALSGCEPKEESS